MSMEQSIVKCNFTAMWVVKMRKIFHSLDKENKGKPIIVFLDGGKPGREGALMI